MLNFNTSLPNLDPVVKKNQMERAAKEMEQTLFTHFLKQMFPEDSAYFGSSHSASLMRSFWVDALSQSGGSKSLGLKEAILKQMSGPSPTPSSSLQFPIQR